MPILTTRTDKKHGWRWLLLPPALLLLFFLVTAVHWVNFDVGGWHGEVGGMPAWMAAQDLEIKNDGFHHVSHGETTISAVRFAGYAYVLVRSRVR